ncbi:type II secretion system protein [Mangrovactinospora gilvigrisea]|uniref:Type II secretion system protein n=1 Tax=Mangrovactinospora gilvigrisea TaxID=1428644 RepID=A0A1J7C7M7_9ACTN|nr:type II secretion system F family protein [Mangrovactinospora gilvigrisea]OIV35650.1 type II secretion system protein [Mangrovactinospora gilvigrisea]
MNQAQLVEAALVGAFVGLGLYALVRGLARGRPSINQRIGRIDALRSAAAGSAAPSPFGSLTEDGEPARPTARERLGDSIARFYEQQGWQQATLRSDLALLGRSWEGFLATKVLLGAFGLIFGPLAWAGLNAIGLQLSWQIPIWLAVLLAAVFFLAPDAEVKRDGAARRRDFRRAVGAYLDLVAMNLAGGRGVPEALMAATQVGEGWELQRIRQTLQYARITGVSQWEALGALGEDLGVEELKDLASALALVADDGAKIRVSLAARAATMRHREMTEIEARAGARSQSMLVAQMLLCLGFMVFLTYPAAMRVFSM